MQMHNLGRFITKSVDYEQVMNKKCILKEQFWEAILERRAVE